MKIMKILAILLVPVLLISCGFFVSPRNKIREVALHPVIDGYIEVPPPPREFTIATMWVYVAGPVCHSLIQFDMSKIPLGSQILSAELRLHCVIGAAGDIIEIFRIKEQWDEGTVDATAIDVALDPIIQLDIPAAPPVFGKTNIRSFVQSWVNGTPNYGLRLSPISGNIEFETIESGRPPELLIRYY